MSDDARLRARFEALRRSEDDRAPDFEALLAAAPVPPPPSLVWRSGWALAVTAGLVLCVLWLGRPADRSLPEAVHSVGGWRTPTDTLLDTPGRELLGAPPWTPLEVPVGGSGPHSHLFQGRSTG